MLQITGLWAVDIVNGQAQVGSVVGTVTDNNVTANLITSPLTPTVNATSPEGYSGGSSVGYNSSTNTYYFGYTQQTIAKSIAINNALQGSGVQVNGVQYGMSYLNGGNTYGTLGMTVSVTSNTGSLLNSYTHTFNTQNAAWQQFDQTQTFTNPYELANLGNVSMAISGKDSRFWAGYYGPQVKDPYLKLTYGSDPKTYYNIPDDGYVPVAIPFAFPFYGQSFTQSYMFSNGVVGFQNPGWNGFCCDGVTLDRNLGSEWHWGIYALQTDLIQANGNAKFYTQTNGSSYLKYAWENINEYGTQNLNTFSATIKPTGYIGLDYQQVNVQYHNVTSGIVGDASIGQYAQYYNGAGSVFPIPGNTITFNGTEVSDPCLINPLSSPTCPGYQQAYFNQQCTINQLYDSACPGYASAYLDYQCSLNPLYSTQCIGYEQAYLDQQCSISPLYSTSCRGYTTAVNECSANPLTHSYCPSYQTAVNDCSTNGLLHSYCPSYTLEQEFCTSDPLSNPLCTGYQTAVTECTSNQLSHSYCPSYQTSLTLCSTDPLSNTMCTGYQTANTECSINALSHTYCAGYQTALSTCSTTPLSNTLCPDYSKAKLALDAALASTAPTTTNNTTAAVVSTTEAAPTISSTGEVTTTVSATGNSTIDAAINTTATSTSPAAAATATVSLAPVASTTPSAPEPKTETKTADAKKEDKQEAKNDTKESAGGSDKQASAGSTGSTSTSDKKPDGPTMRQQIAAKRAEAARTAEVKAGAEAAKELDSAPSFAAQVAVQNVVVAAMGFNAGFDVYKTLIMRDAAGYKPFDIYKNQKTVDNARVLRRMSGASDRLHEEMVASQYKD